MTRSGKSNYSGRQIRFAEAGILFVLILAVTIFVGVKVVPQEREAPVEVVATEADSPDGNKNAITSDGIGQTDPASYQESGEVVELAPASETAAAAHPVQVESPVIAYAQAEAAYFEGRYTDAVEMFALYAQQKPGNAWGYYMLGLACWKDGVSPAAEKAFRTSLELKPDHVKSLVNLGRVLLEQNRAADALPLLEQAVELAPTSTDAYRVLGRAYHNLKRTDEAISAYQGALRQDIDDTWALNNLGLLYLETQQFAAALPPLARAVQLQADVSCFQNNLGMALEHCGQFTAAATAYEGAVDAAPGSVKAEQNLERVAALPDEPGLPAVDLIALAQQFTVAPAVVEAAPGEAIDGAAAGVTLLADTEAEAADEVTSESEVVSAAAIAPDSAAGEETTDVAAAFDKDPENEDE